MSVGPFIRYRAYRHCGGRVRIADEELSCQPLTREHGGIVLLQPRFVGICSADVREVRGERPGRCDFGHEVVGQVLESSCEDFEPGTCVALNPFAPIARETGFAERMYLAGAPGVLDRALLRIPEDRIEFVAVEPLACVIHAARHSTLAARGPKLVLGAGFFGYLLYRYLQLAGVPVRLANRSLDRLASLRQIAPDLRIVEELTQHRDGFASVFLMQSQISAEDVEGAAELVRQDAELVLFGAINSAQDAALHAIRNQQQRVRRVREARSYFLQGTLDALPEDLQEAVDVLSQPTFAQQIKSIFAEPLSFEDGAAHLTGRAGSPRSYRKYVVGLRPG